MGKVVVIPPHEFTIGRMAGTFAVAQAAGTSLSTGLAGRRDALAAFASMITHVPGLAVARGLASHVSVAAAMPSPQPILLEALNAIIVDESDIDRVGVTSGFGARVLDNVQIHLPPPVIGDTAVAAEIAAVPWHLSKVNVGAARAKGLEGAGVLVGVLDTGIDATHPEFAGKIVHFREFDRNGGVVHGPVRDADTHGTHVSGIVAGATTGVAPRAELAVAAVLTTRTSSGMSGYLVQIASGLNWLLTSSFRGAAGDPGVDVVNASLGGTGYDPYLYQLAATARAATGTLLVAAIGNSGDSGMNRHGSPGNYDITLGVGATDSNDAVASFSDWGSVPQHGGLTKPDLCAPGEDVRSSVPQGGFQLMSGTSMASPVVAGAAALLIEQTPMLGLDAQKLTAELLRLTLPLPNQGARVGRGRLDLSAI